MTFQTFTGYAMSQFKKIEQDLRNHGEVRWQNALYLLRLLLTGAATLRTGAVPVRVEAHCDFKGALAETELPEYPDHEEANGFPVTAIRQMAA